MVDQLEVFLQGEGVAEITLIRVPSDGKVRDILKAARALGLTLPSDDEKPAVFLEGVDDEIALDTTLANAGVGPRRRVHVHRCRKVRVSVRYNVEELTHNFGAGITVRAVREWAVGKLKLPPKDAAELALQICGTTTWPDEDVHVGTLTSFSQCSVCFDLVPKGRVQG